LWINKIKTLKPEQSPSWYSQITQPDIFVEKWLMLRLIGVSICWAAAETDIQFTIFDPSSFKKQYLIFFGVCSIFYEPVNG